MIYFSSKSNQLCVVESLQDIQGLVGNLSPSNVNNIIPQVTSMTSIPTNLLCTDCSKEAYNIVAMDLPDLVSQVNLPSLLGGVCGANFTGMPSFIKYFLRYILTKSFADGSTPPDVLQVALPSSTSNAAFDIHLTAYLGSLRGLLISTMIMVTSGFISLA